MMKDKVVLLMRETGCERGEAELALEMCGFNIEQALQAIPRLFQNIAILKGKLMFAGEPLYTLFLAILNLKSRSLLRARAVTSCNPEVYATALDQNWFEFEKRLYACRLGAGTMLPQSQEIEDLLDRYFSSADSAAFYSERKLDARGRNVQELSAIFGRRFGGAKVKLVLHKDVLDMAQFREIEGDNAALLRASDGPRRSERGERNFAPPGLLVLRVALEGKPAGVAAGDLLAGDLVYAKITDTRDIAQYLKKLFRSSADGGSLLVPIEAVEKTDREVTVRVRFSLGVCGDVSLPGDVHVKAVRREESAPWWKRLFS